MADASSPTFSKSDPDPQVGSYTVVALVVSCLQVVLPALGVTHFVPDIAHAVGVAVPAPTVRAGQRTRIEIDGLGALTNSYIAEAT